MAYELRTNVVEPERNTFSYLVERFGDRPATRYQEASFNVQPKENFHYRPTWDPDREMYDPDYSALKLTDPYSYTDPRQYYYTPYVAQRGPAVRVVRADAEVHRGPAVARQAAGELAHRAHRVRAAVAPLRVRAPS